jgi:hypothetical protein
LSVAVAKAKAKEVTPKRHITRREASAVVSAFRLKVGFSRQRKLWVAVFPCGALQAISGTRLGAVETLMRAIGGSNG